MMKSPEGTEKMQTIAKYVRKGAFCLLKTTVQSGTYCFPYSFGHFSFMAYVLGIQNGWSRCISYRRLLFGTCRIFGMKAATSASARVANACRKSLNGGLKLAFRSGAVMELVVVGLVLADISSGFWFSIILLRRWRAVIS